MNKKIFFIFILLLHSVFLLNAVIIKGYIADSYNGEPLPFVNIKIDKQSLQTDKFGYFYYKTTKGKHKFYFYQIGYAPLDTVIPIYRDTVLKIFLTSDINLKTVTVISNRFLENTSVGSIHLTKKEINKYPGLGGEKDVLRVIRYLPGVNSGAEAMAGIYVRGGTPDQNLLLLDDVPIYGSSHLYGFVSIFNPDIIKDVTFIKGGFPAKYSGRLSSVIDVTTLDGDTKKIHGKFSIGLISSKYFIEGPIKKDKITFYLGLRYFYLDLFSRIFSLFIKENSKKIYNFYDFNTKFVFRINSKSRFYIGFYKGADNSILKYAEKDSISALNSIYRTKWGNNLAFAKFTYYPAKRIFGFVQLSYSDYNLGYNYNYTSHTPISNTELSANYKSYIKDLTLSVNATYIPANFYKINFGTYVSRHFYLPGDLNTTTKIFDEIKSSANNTGSLKSTEKTLFWDNKIRFSFVNLNFGVVFSSFFIRNNTFSSLEPRILASFMITQNLSLKAAYSQTKQFTHLLTNSGVGLPTDIWIPATETLPPEKAKQYGAGIFYSKNSLQLGLTGYYKTMSDLTSYLPGTSFFINTKDWETKLTNNGKGQSYGIEFFIKKFWNKTFFRLNYTLSWNFRQFEAINNGEVFPFKYDRRHNLNFLIVYKISKKISISSLWTYKSGNPVTIPVAVYPSVMYPPDPYVYHASNLETVANVQIFYNQFFNNVNIVEYSKRNAYRLPPYHRLDIEAGYNFLLWQKKAKISIGIYNVYNHLNPYFLNFSLAWYQTENGLIAKPEYRVVGLIPLLPYFSFSLKF